MEIDDFPFIYGICNANFLHSYDLYGKFDEPCMNHTELISV
jgi:hypothetical protein